MTRLLAALGLAAATALTSLPLAAQEAPRGVDAQLVESLVDEADGMDRLRALVVARDGEIVLERAFRGPGATTPVNVKSVAKTVISALVGAAIERGEIEGPDAAIGPLLGRRMPDGADPRAADITIGHLLSMQSGLERTSGRNYGSWISSRDWVADALSRPFVDEPGGRMLYSTGNSHILSALLTEVTGRSTHELVRDWLADPLDITIPAWERDPQGIYLGGNNMAISPRALVEIGELYLNGGRASDRQVISEDWIEQSWTPRTSSVFTGHAYGYGWFVVEIAGHDVRYGWGYGGQMLYVVPDLGLVTVITSDPNQASGGSGYVRDLHGLMRDYVIPAAVRSDEAASG